MRRVTQYVVSFPERILRAVAAALGGTIHETAELVLPRLVRTSRFYEATAENLLRITVELVGGVERDADRSRRRVRAVSEEARRPQGRRQRPRARLDPRVRLLAAVAPRRRRRRHARNARLPRRARRRAQGYRRHCAGVGVASVDDLLAALEGASGTTARLDRHPAARSRGTEALARRPSLTTRRACRRRPSSPRSTRDSSPRPNASGAPCSRSRSGSASRSSTPRARSGRQHLLDPYTRGPAPAPRRGVRRLRASCRLDPTPSAVATTASTVRGRRSRNAASGGSTGASCLNRSQMTHPDSFGARSTLDGRWQRARRSSASTRYSRATTSCGSRTRCGCSSRTCCGWRTASP